MVTVDSHCHVSPVWYEPVETLLFQMAENGVDHAVLIQMQAQSDNDYLLECAQRFPGRFAPVVLIDTDRVDASEVLEDCVRRGASGVRLSASVRSPGQDPLSIWHAAGRLGLTVSCAGTSAEFASPAFEALVRSSPNVRFVLEHLASAGKPDLGPQQSEQRHKALLLARYSNVSVKFHGLGEFSQRILPVSGSFPFEQPIPSWLEIAYDAFGPSRLMWGSDFPPVSQREGYRNSLSLPLAQFVEKPRNEVESMFGGNALSAFPIRN